MRQSSSRFLLAALAAVLASCGGGGSGAGDTPAAPPPAPTLTLVAGTLDPGGPGSADGTGTAARFSASDLALGADGNVYVADANNATIRRVTPAGVVTTPWGRAGEPSRVDGTGTAARFQRPRQIAAAPDGSLYVMDALSTAGATVQLRRIAPDGAVTTVLEFPGASEPGGEPWGPMAIDTASRLHFVDSDRCELRRIDLARPRLETLASFPLNFGHCTVGPQVRTDGEGNIYYIESGSSAAEFRKRSTTGAVSVVGTTASSGVSSFAVRRDGSLVFQGYSGQVYTMAPGGTARKLSGAEQISNYGATSDGDADTARFFIIDAMVIAGSGDVLTLDEGSVVRRLRPDGHTASIAGLPPQNRILKSGTGAQARLPLGYLDTLVADAAGNAYFGGASLNYGAIARITPEGVLSIIAGSESERGEQDGVGTAARFRVIRTMARGPSGALLVAEAREFISCGRYGFTTRSVLRQVSADGSVSTLPYVFPGDIDQVAALAGDNLLVTGARVTGHCTSERRAFEVTPAGVESAVAAPPTGPVAANGSGTTWFLSGSAIDKRLPDGRVLRVAGSQTECGYRDGAGADARFACAPRGLDVDATGNVYVADSSNNAVRKITPDGTVSTLVGRPGQGSIVVGPLPGGIGQPDRVLVVPQGLLIRTGLALLRVPL